MKGPPPPMGALPARALPRPISELGSTFCSSTSVSTRVPVSSPRPPGPEPSFLAPERRRAEAVGRTPRPVPEGQSPNRSPQRPRPGDRWCFAAPSKEAEFKRHGLRQSGVRGPQPHWCRRGQLQLASLSRSGGPCTDNPLIPIQGTHSLWAGSCRPPMSATIPARTRQERTEERGPSQLGEPG